MLELLIIVLGFLALYRAIQAFEVDAPAPALAPKRSAARVAQMSEYADRLYAEKKWNGAEKAYLGVLKIDHKNVTAYSHLGVIYSTQKNMPDAIECFEMATRLRPSGVTYQNLGLAYLDNRNYIKSIAAFEKAIMFEPNTQRYIGLSKANRKLSNMAGSVAALEKAAELEPTKRILQMLAEAYTDAGRNRDAASVSLRIRKLDTPQPAGRK